jgi:hypothetical protein
MISEQILLIPIQWVVEPCVDAGVDGQCRAIVAIQIKNQQHCCKSDLCRVTCLRILMELGAAKKMAFRKTNVNTICIKK